MSLSNSFKGKAYRGDNTAFSIPELLRIIEK